MSGKAIVLNPSLMTCDNPNDHDPDERLNLWAIPADRGAMFVSVQGERIESVTVKRAQGHQANAVSLTPFILLTILFHVLAICLVMHLWQHDRGMTNQFFQTQSQGQTLETMTAGAQSGEHTGQPKPVMKAYFVYQRPSHDLARPRSNERPTNVQVDETSLSKLPIKPERPTPQPIKTVSPTPTSLKSPPPVSEINEHSEEKMKPSSSAVIAGSVSKPMGQTVSRPPLDAEGVDTGMAGITKDYFVRQRQQALDELVLSSAQQYTQQQFYAQGAGHNGLSELTPDMEVLVVPNANDISKPSSVDLSLDPNRIVRQGKTCYRIVNVGTQINPYAQNLGFPFNCSGEKMNQAIDDAIQARLEKMQKHTTK